MVNYFAQATEKRRLWHNMIVKCDRQFIWDGKVPDWDETFEQDEPSLVFLKSEKTGTKCGCVLVLAGGCYLYKSVNEGINVAKRMNELGFDAAVLDYRTAPYAKEIILKDAKRAVRWLRSNAEKLGFNADKIAVMGFSAGGNLAAYAAFNEDVGNPDSDDPIERVSGKINALILCYPAINLVDEYSRDENFSLISYYDLMANDAGNDFPPVFIWHSMSDRLIDVRCSVDFAMRLKLLGVPAELHLFPYGGHGQGLADTAKGEVNEHDNDLTRCWSELCARWLKFYGF